MLSGNSRRTFAIAGGLHHAHRGRAAGFSVYNDPAVAIAVARAAHPGLRVMYVDIDAHHGDGVQEAFAGTHDVLTVSVHESGLWLFPGTGFPGETGYDAGEGYAVNVPLPPFAGDEAFALAFERVIEPIARAFVPDVIIAQLGVDAHHLDPQADLVTTLPGYRATVRRVIALADELCEGRLAATGGGGYNLTTVPRAWTWVFAELCGVDLAEELPAEWRARVAEIGLEAPEDLGASDSVVVPEHEATAALLATGETIIEARRRLFGYHGLHA